MRRQLGKESIGEQIVRFEKVYQEVGKALKTLDTDVDPDKLFHPVLLGILFLENTNLNPSEVASGMATTQNDYKYDKIIGALQGQWPDARLLSRDGSVRRGAHAVSALGAAMEEWSIHSEAPEDWDPAWGADAGWGSDQDSCRKP